MDESDIIEGTKQYVVTYNVVVSSDSFRDARRVAHEVGRNLKKQLSPDPNLYGFFMKADKVVTKIKPPIGILGEDEI